MTFNKGLAVSIVTLALGTSAFAMSRADEGRRHDRDEHGTYRPAAYRVHRDHDHDRDDRRPAGWDKGKKEGWHGKSLPPGQVKKQHHDWDRDRDHDRDRDRREREARERRRREWERTHHREHRPVAQHPMTPIKPMPSRPVATNSNQTFGDNVRARKAEIKTQQQRQTKQQGPFIKH